MKLSILQFTAAICRLSSESPIPNWAIESSFFSISKSEDELSLVCDQSSVPADVKAEKEWKIFKVQGPLDFELTGILVSIANPLAKAKISIFTISTFETDYIMVKSSDLEFAKITLQNSGFEVG